MKSKFSSLLPVKLVLKNVASVKKQMGFLFWTPVGGTPPCCRVCGAGAPLLQWGAPCAGSKPGRAEQQESGEGSQARKNPISLAPPHHQPSDWRMEEETGVNVSNQGFLHTEGGLKSEGAPWLTHHPSPKEVPSGWSREAVRFPWHHWKRLLSFSLAPSAHSSSLLSSPSTRVTQ